MYNSRSKAIIFIGRSIDAIRAFPVGVRREAGFQLNKVQLGFEPTDWKSLKAVGAGAREIRLGDESGIYRVIYVAKFEEVVYVLHAFSKKTRKTSKLDIEAGGVAYRKMIEALGK